VVQQNPSEVLQTTHRISDNTSFHKVSLKSRGTASQLDGEILTLVLCKKSYISFSLWYLSHQHLCVMNLRISLISGLFRVCVFPLCVMATAVKSLHSWDPRLFWIYAQWFNMCMCVCLCERWKKVRGLSVTSGSLTEPYILSFLFY
jgi:hypothetical protein